MVCDIIMGENKHGNLETVAKGFHVKAYFALTKNSRELLLNKG